MVHEKKDSSISSRIINEEISIEEKYDKNMLAGPMLVVKDDIESYYIVYPRRETFWKIYDSLPEHLRCFSEVIFEDLSQCLLIHVKFSSPTPFPGTLLVNILKKILSGMLAEFRASHFDKAKVPMDLTDLVVMDECGRDSYGFWTYYFHIQALSFSFCNYNETICFTNNVISRLPKEISPFVVQYLR